jgi:predicted CoA-substrate-specific enzyme activase
MARALGVKLQELGTLSFQSKNDIEVSSMCTVFAESEVISYLSKGFDKSDVAAAIHNAIARRVAGMVGQLGLVERVAMTGGVAKNPGVVRSLEMKLGTTLLLPEEPQIMGALGAALIAAGQISPDGISSAVGGSKA